VNTAICDQYVDN